MVASRKMGWGLHPITLSGDQCVDIFWSIIHDKIQKLIKFFTAEILQCKLLPYLVISSNINHDR